MYKLIKNHLFRDEERYNARVVYTETLYMKDIIELMMYHGSTVTRADIIAVVEDLVKAIIMAVLLGKRVVTPFGTFGLRVKGNFNGPEDTIEEGRHEVLSSIRRSTEFEDAIDNQVTLTKHRPGVRRPSPLTCKNFHKGASDTELSPGHIARIYGELLRFDPEDPEKGIFLIPTDNGGGLLNGTEVVRVEEVTRSTGSEATFLVPADLTAGDYILEVRTRLTQKNLRTGQLEQILTVPAG
jgi:hypothetical protein